MINMKEDIGRRASFGCTLPGRLLQEIDRRRGMVNRSRYIEMLIDRALDMDEHPELRRGSDRRMGER